LKGLNINAISRHLSVYLNPRKGAFFCYSQITEFGVKVLGMYHNYSTPHCHKLNVIDKLLKIKQGEGG
jgi:hypothetical protein